MNFLKGGAAWLATRRAPAENNEDYMDIQIIAHQIGGQTPSASAEYALGADPSDDHADDGPTFEISDAQPPLVHNADDDGARLIPDATSDDEEA